MGPNLFQLIQGCFWLQTHLGPPKSQKRKRWWMWKMIMMNRFFEECLIYFKSEMILNSKLSHVANLLIRSHLAVTTKSSGWSEMVNCVKFFCFRPNQGCRTDGCPERGRAGEKFCHPGAAGESLKRTRAGDMKNYRGGRVGKAFHGGIRAGESHS